MSYYSRPRGILLFLLFMVFLSLYSSYTVLSQRRDCLLCSQSIFKGRSLRLIEEALQSRAFANVAGERNATPDTVKEPQRTLSFNVSMAFSTETYSQVSSDQTASRNKKKGDTRLGRWSKPVRIAAKDVAHTFREVPCDVPCQWTEKSARGTVGEYYVVDMPPPNIILKSMEGSHYYRMLRAKQSNQLIFATTSFKSDIPMPYYFWKFTEYLHDRSAYNAELAERKLNSSIEYDSIENITEWNWIQRPDIARLRLKNFENLIPKVLFMARNCASKNNREGLIKEMMSYGIVDSVSSCLQNKRLSFRDLQSKESVMQKYMFYAAFENGCVDDYITEKLWGALGSGTLPIYYGAPNIWEHVPEKSLVSVNDFPSVKALVSHIRHLSQNETAYEEYHAWRFKRLPPSFVNKYNFTHTHSECRICRFVKAKKEGLVWDQINQKIT